MHSQDVWSCHDVDDGNLVPLLYPSQPLLHPPVHWGCPGTDASGPSDTDVCGLLTLVFKIGEQVMLCKECCQLHPLVAD